MFVTELTTGQGGRVTGCSDRSHGPGCSILSHVKTAQFAIFFTQCQAVDGGILHNFLAVVQLVESLVAGSIHVEVSLSETLKPKMLPMVYVCHVNMNGYCSL